MKKKLNLFSHFLFSINFIISNYLAFGIIIYVDQVEKNIMNQIYIPLYNSLENALSDISENLDLDESIEIILLNNTKLENEVKILQNITIRYIY